MEDKYLNLSGIQRLWSKIKAYIDNIVSEKVGTTDAATATKYGLVKLNPSESVTLNASGQLDVGGRLGQMSGTTGTYSPKTISPAYIGNGSFLLTEASGTTLGDKSLSVTTGSNLSLSTTAPAGSTVYNVANTYENRIKAFMAIDGVVALNEASSSKTARVVSVKIDNTSVVPSSSSNSSTPITIEVEESVNPNSSTSSIRIYPTQTGYSNLLVGQAVRTNAAGANAVVGQCVYSGKNACCVIGASMYNNGNGSALFGKLHINTKNRAFLAGTGHDTTNAPSENVAAFGAYSNLSSDTLFAVGSGTSATQRKNAFEITNDGAIVLRSPNGTRYKIAVDNNGTITSTAI